MREYLSSACSKMLLLPRLICVVFSALLVVSCLVTDLMADDEKEIPHVLILSSYHQGYAWTDDIVQGVKDQFAESGMDIQLSCEYLDTKRHPETKDYFDMMETVLEHRYRALPVNLVITCDNSAFNFAVQYRSKIFPDAPVVFCGLNNYTPDMRKLLPKCTGVMERKGMAETLAVMHKLHPKAKNLALISDATETGKIDADLVRTAAKKQGIFKIIELSGGELSRSELLAKLKTLPPDTLLFLSGFCQDRTGAAQEVEELLHPMALAAQKPIYTHVNFFVKDEIVGGVVVHGHHQGSLAGKMAIQILHGKDPNTIPVEGNSFIPFFNCNGLKLWKIDQEQLPPNSRVINCPPPGLYQTHRALVWGVAAAFALLVGFIIVLVINIVKRHRAEHLMNDSRQRLELAISGADLGTWDWNITTGEVKFNERWAEIVGYSLDEVEPNLNTWKKLVHPDEAEWVNAAVKNHLEGKTEIYETEHRLRHKDGHWIWILDKGKVIQWSSSGAPLRACGTHLDITERKTAELALRESEENLRVTLHSIGDAVIATDTDGQVVQINPVAEKLTGWAEEEAIGRPLQTIFQIINARTRERLKDPLTRVLESGEVVTLSNHTLLLSRNGQEYQIADSGAPIRDDDGNIIGVVLVFRDVTEEYALQEQLRQSQKMDAIGQLAGGIAHDFNNMLHGIMSATDLLATSVPDNPINTESINIIQQSASRAADLTTNLLAFARRQPRIFNPVDIRNPLKDAVTLLKRTVDPSIRTNMDVPDKPAMVVGDSAQLQSCFLNLLINSSHAMHGGGTISIALSKTDLDEDYCSASNFDLEPGPYAKVEIRDTGSGISPEDLPHIFEPFYTTKEAGKGTGLGLAAVLGNIQQHQGAITAYSEENAGTIFEVLLPLAQTSEQPVPTKPEGAISGSGRILLVDDEPLVLQATTAILKSLGYEVETASNGRQALEKFEPNSSRFDLVILDMIMPEMNGRECLARLKSLKPDVRVILASGFAHKEDLSDIQNTGIKDFLHKPIKIDELSRAVHNALRD